MIAAILTAEQAQELMGQEFAPDSFFNPVKDASGNWVISIEEIKQCENEKFSWVRELEKVEVSKVIAIKEKIK